MMPKNITFISVLFLSVTVLAAPAQKKIKVVCLGDSITEGYGVNRDQAYPALIQEKFDEKYPGKIEVVNAGISGSTTASVSSRMKWFLKLKPELIFFALGANDGLRGIDPANTKMNLENAIIDSKKAGIHVILGGMKLPPNYGKVAAEKFKAIYLSLSKAHSIPLVPFILEGVGGDKSLNIEDGIHPNPKGHVKLATLIFPYLDAEVQKVMKAEK